MENSFDSDRLDSGFVCAHSHHRQNNPRHFGELVEYITVGCVCAFLGGGGGGGLESVNTFTSI